MDPLIPLTVAVPLLAAALLAAFSPFVTRRVIELSSIAVAAAVTAMCLLLLSGASEAPLVYWFGGHMPRDGLALGIAFVVDPLGAALAAFAGVLVTATLVYSWRYFDAVGVLFHSLLLIFLAGIIGLAISGDLFNIFVFLELLSVAAFALTGYKIEETGPLQGALNFGVTNTVGAFFVLWGIALLYGRTGALNLAQMGETLAGGPVDSLVVTAIALLATGFFIKAAIVPFHFWLADTYATAPLPVCILLGGVVSELGLFAFARVYWTVFDGALASSHEELRMLLLVAGALTAVVGAVMSFAQRHLQRMLAFSVIAHAGLLLVGLGLMSPAGLAGVAVYLLADGLVKASLFMCLGILQHRLGGVDELRLHGRARHMIFTGALFLVGGLVLAGIPPAGTYAGKALLEEEANLLGLSWVTPLFVLVSCLTGGAVLRAAGKVFMGWGPPPGHSGGEEDAQVGQETTVERDRTPAVMFVPALVLLTAAIIIPFVPGLLGGSEAAAVAFADRPAYAGSVLLGTRHPITEARAHEWTVPTELIAGAASVIGAVALAAFTLRRAPLPQKALGKARTGAERVVGGLTKLHSRHIGDYMAWLTMGAALLGGALAAAFL